MPKHETSALSMKELKLDLNFDRLKSYFPNITKEEKAAIREQGGYWFNFDWEYDDDTYIRFYDSLLKILDSYEVQDHINELYFITMMLDYEYRSLQDILDQDYQDTQTSKELAQFLLTFKTAKPNQSFSISAKAMTKSGSVKDERIAKWMCQQIYEAIESKNFPFEIFGEKVLLHLFGSDPMNSKTISMDKLEAASKLNPRKPTYKKYLANFSIQLRAYLNEYTSLTTPEGVLLANTHANLFFDIFEMLGYLDRMQISSEPKDYMHALLRNHLKPVY
jgi:hypothetical protein